MSGWLSDKGWAVNLGSPGPIGNVTPSTGKFTTLTATQNVVIGTAGKGIDFSAVTPAPNMTSQLLNDYEEGDWLAVVSDGTTDATMAATYCTYTKIGRMVTLTGYVATSSVSGLTNPLQIKGLPFVSQAAGKFYSATTAGLGGGLLLTAGQSISMIVQPSSNYMNLYVWSAVAGTASVYPATWTNSGSISFCISYFVA